MNSVGVSKEVSRYRGQNESLLSDVVIFQKCRNGGKDSQHLISTESAITATTNCDKFVGDAST
ncbi:MAG: hypothetical protein VX262_06405, partial [Acidobacteriota bacterium]|nr:hypothetical protein [Acidobacteriota bacterium]